MWFNSFRWLATSTSGKSPAMSRGRSAQASKNSRRRAFLMSLEQLEVRMVPSTFTVSNLNGGAAYSKNDGSLRGEIAAASPGDTIQFKSTLAGGTINLTGGQI